MQVEYYDRSNLGDLKFADDHDAQYAKRMLAPLIEDGTKKYFANVECDLAILVVDGRLIPISITGPAIVGRNQSFVCSPIAHYIDYGLREIDIEFTNRPITNAILKSIIRSFRWALIRPGFDRVVMVNNWLLSTNLYPNLEAEAVDWINRCLIAKFPGHTIIYRSVNPELNETVLKTLSAAGFQSVLSRQVYLMDVASGEHRNRRALKIDRKLQRRSPHFYWADASSVVDAELPRLKALYDSLYIEKYAQFNPQLTVDFFRDAMQRNWLDMWVLRDRDSGLIVAAIGYFERDGVMTTPVIGYDRSLPKKTGLYRLITLKIIEQAETHDNFLHMSSGAAHFKRLRGGRSCFEYNMVFVRHLTWKRRLPWSTLAWLTKWIAKPVFRWFEL